MRSTDKNYRRRKRRKKSNMHKLIPKKVRISLESDGTASVVEIDEASSSANLFTTIIAIPRTMRLREVLAIVNIGIQMQKKRCVVLASCHSIH